MRKAIFVLATALVLAAAGFAHYLRPRVLVLAPATRAPECGFRDTKAVVTLPGAAFIATVATFDDELYAYFNYDYLRSRRAVQPAEVLLTRKVMDRKAVYPILIHMGDDLMTAIPFLEKLRVEGYIPSYEWRLVPESEVHTWRQQTQVFTAAYNLPVEQRIEGLSSAQLQEVVRRFVIFKSRTDRRVRKGIEPVPPPLSDEAARALARNA